jgi:hypothetical protein
MNFAPSSLGKALVVIAFCAISPGFSSTKHGGADGGVPCCYGADNGYGEENEHGGRQSRRNMMDQCEWELQ